MVMVSRFNTNKLTYHYSARYITAAEFKATEYVLYRTSFKTNIDS